MNRARQTLIWYRRSAAYRIAVTKWVIIGAAIAVIAILISSFRAHPDTVYGSVGATRLAVSGPVVTTEKIGTTLRASGAAPSGNLTVAGDLNVRGDLIVKGALRVGGVLEFGERKCKETIEAHAWVIRCSR